MRYQTVHHHLSYTTSWLTIHLHPLEEKPATSYGSLYTFYKKQNIISINSNDDKIFEPVAETLGERYCLNKPLI